MFNLISIFMYGRDLNLLETRRAVLKRAGHTVWAATTLAEIDQAKPAEQIDVLILCHSLSMEECGRALALAHTRWPSVRSLILTAGASGCSREQFLEQTFDVVNGPAKLISTVGNLSKRANTNPMQPVS